MIALATLGGEPLARQDGARAPLSFPHFWPGNYRVQWPCIDLFPPPRFPRLPPIIVGCEVIDCCPGCPGPGFLDWRILVQGPDLGPLQLRFENLPEAARERLQIRGDARWQSRDTLLVSGKEVLLSGFPVQKGVRPPAVFADLAFDQDRIAAARGLNADSADEDRGEIGSVQVSIEQLLDRTVVNEAILEYRVRRCTPPVLEFPDQIRLVNNTDNDDAVVFIDGRRSGACIDDFPRRGVSLILTKNLQSPLACANELAVFSDDNAVAFLDGTNGNAPGWTDAANEVTTVSLRPLLNVPVTVWLVAANTGPRAVADVANANLLYNSNHLGLAFQANIQNVSNNPNAAQVATSGTNACSTAWINALTSSAFFTPGQLNVYYVAGSFTGFNCIAARNIIMVGTTANNQTLAHEFGHAFSLPHTNGVAGFPGNNVMIGGGSGRTHFSEGQAYRVNRHVGSVLFANGITNVVPRNCDVPGANCLPMATDVVPN